MAKAKPQRHQGEDPQMEISYNNAGRSKDAARLGRHEAPQNIILLRLAIIWCFCVLVAKKSHEGTRHNVLESGLNHQPVTNAMYGLNDFWMIGIHFNFLPEFQDKIINSAGGYIIINFPDTTHNIVAVDSFINIVI